MAEHDFRRSYSFGKGSLTLEFGDITRSKAEVIVSSDDCFLSMGGGVSAAIARAAGESLLLDVVKKLPAKLGDVVVSTAGALDASYIFHAVTIDPGRRTGEQPKDLVRELTAKCLGLCAPLGVRSIAFPAIGAGVARFPYDEVALAMAEVIADDLNSRESPLDVTICLYDRFGQMQPIDFIPFFEEFGSRMRTLGSSPPSRIAAEDDEEEDDDQPCVSDEVDQRTAVLNELARLTRLRDDLEKKLVLLAGGLSGSEQQSIENDLSRIRVERGSLLEKLHRPSVEGLRVFVSYSHKDEGLRERLGKHANALERQGIVKIWHDRKITPGSDFSRVIDQQLSQADVVLLLVSADFVASDYCYGKEMTMALERHATGDCLVIPVLLRPVHLAGLPIDSLLFLPTDRKAVTQWKDEDSAFMDVVTGIRTAIDEWVRPRSPAK